MENEKLLKEAEIYFIVAQTIYGLINFLIDYFILIDFLFEKLLNKSLDVPSKLLLCGLSSMLSIYLYGISNKQKFIDKYLNKYKEEK